jgi:hypothetical protein
MGALTWPASHRSSSAAHPAASPLRLKARLTQGFRRRLGSRCDTSRDPKGGRGREDDLSTYGATASPRGAGRGGPCRAPAHGHANIAITLDRFGHLMPGSEDEAAALLDGYLARGTRPGGWPNSARGARRSRASARQERRGLAGLDGKAAEPCLSP